MVQSGKPVGVFRTHTDAPRVLIAQHQHRAALGDAGAVRRVRTRRADDVRPDDGGVLDLHRHAGDIAGHVSRRLARWRGSTAGTTLAGKLVLTAGLGEMGGAQPQAVTFNGGVGILCRGRSMADRAAAGSSSRSMSAAKDLDELALARRAIDKQRSQVHRPSRQRG